MTHKLRFSVQTAPQETDFKELRTSWKEIETLGYDCLWMFDHLFPIHSDPSGPCIEGWTCLTAAAMETTRIRVGVLVSANSYRHPGLLANMAAAVDQLSGGRLQFSLGGAWNQREHDAFGFSFPPLRERIERLDEALTICKRLWTEESVTFSGKHYRLNEAYCSPKPVQKPYPPVMIGGKAKPTLRTVARHADIWNTFGSPEIFREKLGILKEWCAKEGRDFDSIEKSVGLKIEMSGDKSREEALIQNRMKAWKLSYESSRGHLLLGEPEAVKDQIAAFHELGITHIVILMFAPFDMHSLRVFAEKVMPSYR